MSNRPAKCPRCGQSVSITRFGPYDSTKIFRWLFSCQRLSNGCGWWSEHNNPFYYDFMVANGLSPLPTEKKKTMEEVHNEWRESAGLSHLSFNKAIQQEERRLLDEAAKAR